MVTCPLDASELDDEFSVGLGEGVIVIRHEQDGVGVTHITELYFAMTVELRVGTWRVDEDDATLGPRGVDGELDLFDDTALLFLRDE